MTNSNGNNSSVCEASRRHRLDRIEAIVESNSRTIQGILEQQATDRLKREEEKAEHIERMRFLEENQRQPIQTQRGIDFLHKSKILVEIGGQRSGVVQTEISRLYRGQP